MNRSATLTKQSRHLNANFQQKNPRALAKTGIAYEYPNTQVDEGYCAFL